MTPAIPRGPSTLRPARGLKGLNMAPRALIQTGMGRSSSAVSGRSGKPQGSTNTMCFTLKDSNGSDDPIICRVLIITVSTETNPLIHLLVLQNTKYCECKFQRIPFPVKLLVSIIKLMSNKPSSLIKHIQKRGTEKILACQLKLGYTGCLRVGSLQLLWWQ